MATNNSKTKMLLLLLCFAIAVESCAQTVRNKSLDTYDQYRSQKISPRDRAFIFYTVKEWKQYPFEDYSLMYRITNDDVEYFLGGVFYSPDKQKMMVWIGTKTPNARTSELYNKEDTDAYVNKMCPTTKDTVYRMTALVGIRNDTNEFWKLYPFGNRSAGCYHNKTEVINEMSQYYFIDMKGHQMKHIVQSGISKGKIELKAYGYNLQDTGFWDKCWLWEKDTVGAANLYPFQLDGYLSYPKPTCNKCASELILPSINYPEEIWDMYPRSKAIRDSLNRPEVKASIKAVQQAQEQEDAKRWKELLDKKK